MRCEREYPIRDGMGNEINEKLFRDSGEGTGCMCYGVQECEVPLVSECMYGFRHLNDSRGRDAQEDKAESRGCGDTKIGERTKSLKRTVGGVRNTGVRSGKKRKRKRKGKRE